MLGYIPDNSSEITDIIGTKIGDVAANDLAGVIASVNNANQKIISTNKNYN